MNTQLESVVWEVTLRCNLRCRLCGSAAGKAREDELSTQEMLDVCGQMGRLGVRTVTLMGGEPLVREDWPLIISELTTYGVSVDMVSNGVLVNEISCAKMRDVGLHSLSVSLDGSRMIHDNLRGKSGQFEQVERAVERAQDAGIPVGVITHVNQENIASLDKLYRHLVDWQVDGWQIQMTSPAGAARSFAGILRPEQAAGLAEWIVHKRQRGELYLYAADDLGYFVPNGPSHSESHSRQWNGCQAGIRSLGVTSDGTVRGCMSLPDTFDEANLRTHSLEETWNNPNAFAWNRSPRGLSGSCEGCHHGDQCRGGCPSFSHARDGRIGSYPHCWWVQRGQ